MSDEEILSYLNEWENVPQDSKKWLEETDFEGLAREFRVTFKEQIIPDEARFKVLVQ